jgi:hypothetical protein
VSQHHGVLWLKLYFMFHDNTVSKASGRRPTKQANSEQLHNLAWDTG